MTHRQCLGTCFVVVVLAAPGPSPSGPRPEVPGQVPRLPLVFQPNVGQFDPAVRFSAVSGPLRVSLRDGAVRLAAGDAHGDFGWRLAGAKAPSAVVPLEPARTRVSYFIGRDPAAWRHNVPTYHRVEFRDVYPGVDVAYYSHTEGLEFDFIVRAGGDPRAIRLAFEAPVTLAPTGEVLAAEGAALRAPVAYQIRNGARHRVASRFVARSPTDVAIDVGEYHAGLPLVIDPVLAFSTFVGGAGADSGLDLAVNAGGESYLVGSTASLDLPAGDGAYPANNGGSDAYIGRLSADGSSLVSATYLGGSNNDAGTGVAVDPAGNVYVTGSTISADFPSLSAFQPSYVATNCVVFQTVTEPCRDAFVAKLSPDGDALLYSTFFGGSHHDAGVGIDVDSAGQAYVLGTTTSPDLPLLNAVDPSFVASGCGSELVSRPCPDTFVLKLSAAGSARVYSTYLGGDLEEQAGNIIADAAGGAIVVGASNSPNLPVVAALQPAKVPGSCGLGIASHHCFDAFVSRFLADGSLLFSTYFGGTREDYATDVAFGADGAIWFTGHTNSADLPLADPLQPALSPPPPNGCEHPSMPTIPCSDAMIAGLDAFGTALIKSTYLGGLLPDRGLAIAVDAAGAIAIAGDTGSTDFPVEDPWQRGYSGAAGCRTVPCTDAFVSVVRPDFSGLAYSTFLGAAAAAVAEGIAAGPGGSFLVAGSTRTGFPVTAGAFRTVAAGGEAFVTKFFAPPAAGVLVTIAGTGAAGTGETYGTPALSTAFGAPFHVVDRAGTRYVSDAANHRVFKITPSNEVYPVAGTGDAGSAGDGGVAVEAQLNTPTGLTLDAAGNLYIADTGNHRVRMVTPEGGIYPVAGNGIPGFRGDYGVSLNARLNSPTGVFAADNKLLIADTGNRRVRMVVNLRIQTIAGNGFPGSFGDGRLSVFASLTLPTGVTMNGADVIVADYGAHTIRRITPNAIISTIAGTRVPGFGGDGGPATAAQLNGPFAVVSAQGSLYFSDQLNHRIRRVAADGTISTIAGTGVPGTMPVPPGPGVQTALSYPGGIAFDDWGNLLIADVANRRVAMVHRAVP